MSDYLIARNGILYFARRVPAKLVPIIGRRFWRETLATTDAATARKLAAQCNADCEQAIAVAMLEYRRQRSAVARLTTDEREVVQAAGGLGALRVATVGEPQGAATVWHALPDRLRAGLPADWSRLTPEQQKELSARWLALPEDTRKRLLSGTWNVPASLRADTALATALAGMLADLTTDRRTVGPVGAPGRLATANESRRAGLAAEGIDLDGLQDELAQAEAHATTLRARLERNLAILRKGPEAAADPDLASDYPQQQAAAETLQTVLDRWAKESGAPEQHVGLYRYAVRRFHELHGQIGLAEITRAHLRQFLDAIIRLPRSTRPDLRTAQLARAIALADKEGLPRIEERTARKHVMALSTLLGHAVSWGYIERSPADGFRFIKKREKRSQDNDRRGFTPAQLRALDASLAAEYKDTDDDRWLPIVCAYQGCRQEEACQLLKSDVWQHESGIWVMRITDAGDDQKVKNKSSVRTIPIHAKLIELGFLDHVKRSKGPLLFASLKPDQRGRLGGPYGKRFARHLQKPGDSSALYLAG